MQKLFIVFYLTMAIGCENRTGKTTAVDSASVSTKTQTDERPANKTDLDVTGCYMQVLKRDTFTTSLQQQGDVITGTLSFDNYEKDASSGRVNGKLEADVLKLVYSFNSEGMKSVMEVYFKYRDGELLRGIGEMDSKGDSAYFIDPASIKYEGTGFKKISCENLPQKNK